MPRSVAEQSATDLAKPKTVSVASVGRPLTRTGLAPDIVEAILDGRQPRRLSVDRMLKAVPEHWEERRRPWECPAAKSGAAVPPGGGHDKGCG